MSDIKDIKHENKATRYLDKYCSQLRGTEAEKELVKLVEYYYRCGHKSGMDHSPLNKRVKRNIR